MHKVEIDSLLPLVSKPSRYINHEINAIHKPACDINVCLAFPDAYEVGISHLGLKILYTIFNEMDFVMADRCYLPWMDMADLMRQRNVALFGWESRYRVKDFDLLGITLQSELTFSNVLELLELAGMQVHSKDRDENDPIVLAGGPCASNPLPLSPFIDAFFMGEAEESLLLIAQALRDNKSKEQRLSAIAKIPGIYVPAMYKNGEVISSQKFMGFGTGSQTHAPQLLPWQLATHNRYVAEIMRGCSRGCRFCHAGYFYRPVRERNPQQLLMDILSEIKSSGWDEVGLVSLSSSDYSCVRDLLKALLEVLDTDKTHVSLPSLRVDTLDDELIGFLKKLGREGLTIAPEAGSQRLRDVINKNLSAEEIMEGVNTAIKLGWQKLKLYFMLGLPTETEDDVDAIIDLISAIDGISRKKLQINVTLSPFVPKAFTPFQWCAMAPKELLLARCLRIKNAFAKRKYIKVKYHTIESSILEALISRADASFGGVIYQAWKRGARFDAWNEGFDYQNWKTAMEAEHYDGSIINREIVLDRALPWDFVDIGISKSFLVKEYNQAMASATTMDCRLHCSVCGACNQDVFPVNATLSSFDLHNHQQSPARMPNNSQKQYRYRVFYRKLGVLRFVSHLDWMRMLFRLISMLSLDVVYTQGFNPHPKVSLSPPLPMGVNGNCEFFDISLRNPAESGELCNIFSGFGIADFIVYDAIPIEMCKAIMQSETITMDIKGLDQESIAKKIEDFFACESMIYTKQKAERSKSYELKQIVHDMRLSEQHLIIRKELHSPSLYDLLSFVFDLDRETLYSQDIYRITLD